MASSQSPAADSTTPNGVPVATSALVLKPMAESFAPPARDGSSLPVGTGFGQRWSEIHASSIASAHSAPRSPHPEGADFCHARARGPPATLPSILSTASPALVSPDRAAWTVT